MLTNFVMIIISILGIYGFYSDTQLLLTIAGILIIIENLYGRFSGQLKTLSIPIIAAVVGVIVIGNIWRGIAIGLCFETIIFSLLGWIYIAFIAKHFD